MTWPRGCLIKADAIVDLVGLEGLLLRMFDEPPFVDALLERIVDYYCEVSRRTFEAAAGAIDVFFIGNDFGGQTGPLVGPQLFRRFLLPPLRRLSELCHRYGLPVIYHGCGNVKRVLGDFAEMGLEACNPLEAKAGLDVVELRRTWGHRLGFCGNMDVQAWAQAPLEELERIVLTKLNAARGGGFIFQSDHSAPSNVSGERYDAVVKLVRERGRYPLALGEQTLPDLR